MLSCDVDGEGSGAGRHLTPLELCPSLISSSLLSRVLLACVSIVPWGLYLWVAFWYSCNDGGGGDCSSGALLCLFSGRGGPLPTAGLPFPPHPLLPALLCLS